MKRGDCILLAVLLVLAGALLLPRLFAADAFAGKTVVYVNGEPARESLTIHGVAVEIDGSRARVASAPCPDQICVHTGWLERPGDTAICLPQKVIVELRAASQEVDGVAY